MWGSEQVNLVEQRINFVKLINETREQFRGKDKIIHKNENGFISHYYKHFDALRIYLLLTCFDILGQPNDWMNFHNWLESKKTKNEREPILKTHSNKNNAEFIQAVQKDYNKIYGVKNSFVRFIREILNDKNKHLLFDSIKISHTVNKKTSEVSNDLNQKEGFILDIRNSFTHKGISIGNGSYGRPGMIDPEKPFRIPGEEGEYWGYSPIFQKKSNNGETLTFSVSRWPNVLIEIIEDTLENSDLRSK